MDCRDLTALAADRLAGELDEPARRALASHLAGCEACRAEMTRLEGVWTTLGEDPDAQVTPEFRRRTLGLIEEEMLRSRVRTFRPRRAGFLRPFAQAAALVAAGSLGWVLARTAAPGSRPAAAATAPGTSAAASSPAASAALPPDLGSNPRLSNVSYEPAGPDGKVAVAFDVTTRRAVSGRPEDPDVARLLAYLVAHNAETAGEKSRAIQLVSEHYGAGLAAPSPEIVAALTNTLKKDANPGVRKKAADALASLTMTPEIRAAFLDSLRSDKNPAVRLVAVEALAAAAKQSPDANTIESLREKAVDPQENGFVRAKAASALKAISF
jgi:hypothetical protein